MDEPIDVVEKKHGIRIEIWPDTDPISPREDPEANFGTMVCWHRNYSLGEERPRIRPEEWFRQHPGFYKNNVVVPIMAYEHGGITIRAYDYGNWPDQQWDCGQLGFIYVSKEKIRSVFGVKHVSKRLLEKAEKMLVAEIDTYDEYLCGNACGYMIKDEDDTVLDSCFGYLGYDGEHEAMTDAEVSANYFVGQRQAEKDAMEQRLAIASAGVA